MQRSRAGATSLGKVAGPQAAPRTRRFDMAAHIIPTVLGILVPLSAILWLLTRGI